jgi:hypothetical protein
MPLLAPVTTATRFEVCIRFPFPLILRRYGPLQRKHLLPDLSAFSAIIITGAL